MADNRQMLKELRSEAAALLGIWGADLGQYWTVNPDAGTIRDVRDGTLYCFLSREWLRIDEEDKDGL